jgi:hypothetical protein
MLKREHELSEKERTSKTRFNDFCFFTVCNNFRPTIYPPVSPKRRDKFNIFIITDYATAEIPNKEINEEGQFQLRVHYTKLQPPPWFAHHSQLTTAY